MSIPVVCSLCESVCNREATYATWNDAAVCAACVQDATSPEVAALRAIHYVHVAFHDGGGTKAPECPFCFPGEVAA